MQISQEEVQQGLAESALFRMRNEKLLRVVAELQSQVDDLTQRVEKAEKPVRRKATSKS